MYTYEDLEEIFWCVWHHTQYASVFSFKSEKSSSMLLLCCYLSSGETQINAYHS